jgi:hypothetical protein
LIKHSQFSKYRNWNEVDLHKFKPPLPQQPLSYKWNPMTYRNVYQYPTQLNRVDLNRQLALPSSTSYSRNLITNNQQTWPRVGRSIINRNEEWEHRHYQAHRDRRDLYERIEAASPL